MEEKIVKVDINSEDLDIKIAMLSEFYIKNWQNWDKDLVYREDFSLTNILNNYLKKYQPSNFIVLYKDNKLVGCVHTGFFGEMGRPTASTITLLCTAKDYGLGYGKKLIEIAEQDLIEKGTDVICLSVQNGLRSLHRFYNRLGYNPYTEEDKDCLCKWIKQII